MEGHPEDYLTLSKILWHSNINTTIRIYGRNFDESHGAWRVEKWLDSRKKATDNRVYGRNFDESCATRYIEDWLDHKALRTRPFSKQPDFANLFEEAVEKGLFSQDVLPKIYTVLRRKLGYRP